MIIGYGKGLFHTSPPSVDRDTYLEYSLSESALWVWPEDQEDFEVIAKEFAKQVNSGVVPHIALLRWASRALAKIADGKEQLFNQTKRKLVAKPPGKGRPKNYQRDIELITDIEAERKISGMSIDKAVAEALKQSRFRGLTFDAAKQIYKRKRNSYGTLYEVPDDIVEEIREKSRRKKGQK